VRIFLVPVRLVPRTRGRPSERAAAAGGELTMEPPARGRFG
jgi:hypothetical protein